MCLPICSLTDLIAALKSSVSAGQFSSAVDQVDNSQFEWCKNLHPGQITFIGVYMCTTYVYGL